MEFLNVDSIGPLPPDQDGNTYIIVIIDRFSRWIELIPAKDATSFSAATALLQHTGRFGAPSHLLSDGGSQYVNELIKELITLIGVEHEVTLAYSKEENSIVERSNKGVLRHLKNIVFERHILAEWSRYLPIVQRIINTSVHESLGISPAQLLLGNAVTLDSETFLPKSQRDPKTTLSEWATKRLEQQELLLSRATLTQQKLDQTNLKKRIDKRHPQTEPKQKSKQSNSSSDSPDSPQPKRRAAANIIADDFKPGDLVLVSYPDNSLGKGRPPHKLMMPLRGPFAVVSKLRGNYTLRELAPNKEANFNAHLIRPYIHDAKHDNPYAVALQDMQANARCGSDCRT